MMVAMMAVVFLSAPLGMSLQKHFTTEGDLGDLELVSVTRDRKTLPFSDRQVTLHRVDDAPGIADAMSATPTFYILHGDDIIQPRGRLGAHARGDGRRMAT